MIKLIPRRRSFISQKETISRYIMGRRRANFRTKEGFCRWWSALVDYSTESSQVPTFSRVLPAFISSA